MKKSLCIFMTLFAFVCCIFLVSCSNSGKKETADSTSDDLAKYMTIAQQEIEKYYNDLSYSYKSDDWIIFHDSDNDTTSISTKASKKSDAEKKVLNVIVTLSESEEKYTPHFIEYGGEILLDDGTIE